MIRSISNTVLMVLASSSIAAAQPPAPAPAGPPPPPPWDLQLGASFVGTSGNSHTSTLGIDFGAHRRWEVWRVETTAAAVSASDGDKQTAERFLAAVRVDRKLTDRLELSAGDHLERDRLAGMDFRSIADAGVKFAAVRQQAWTVDTLTSLAWNHEEPVSGLGRNDPVGLLQAVSKYAFGTTSDTTERFTYYPDFRDSSAYRAEFEAIAQASMNARLALKIGYLWRYSNSPTDGFVKSDNTATASIVVRWKPTPPAP